MTTAEARRDIAPTGIQGLDDVLMLLMYLGQKGVAAILVEAQHGVVGTSMFAPVDVSYLEGRSPS